MTIDEQVLEVAKSSMECTVNCTHDHLKHGLNGLATIGATAPFVGLFGTVIGIINSFRGSTVAHATTLSGAASGISEALITTSLGLLVAVPAVWAYNYLVNKMEVFDMEMKDSVDDVAAYLAEFQMKHRGY